MVWFCTKHNKHSIDDLCPECSLERKRESLARRTLQLVELRLGLKGKDAFKLLKEILEERK